MNNIHILFEGYHTILSSTGALLDTTPPYPGHLENIDMDVTNKEDCNSFVPSKYLQRCVDISPVKNYRYIADGTGSTAVGNGHQHGTDLRYTRANRMIGGNTLEVTCQNQTNVSKIRC